MGTGAGKGESLALDGVSVRWILYGECGTHDDGDDDKNIDKSDGLLSVHPHIATAVTSLGQIADNRPPDICD